MEITHGSQMSYEDANAKHRSGGIEFKYLSRGTESTLENYLFVLARQQDFFSPRHHHNFDQFRYAVKGDFNLGPDLDLKEGQLAYHPEGVHYGPQNDGPEERHLLVLQFGGASGQGYASLDQIRAANAELEKVGKFEKGKYYPDGGESDPIDGYEASWSQVMGGKKLVYPDGRYNAPIIMDPANFRYRDRSPGVSTKLLGVFTEREVRVEMCKIEEAGRLSIGEDRSIHLLYVLHGKGDCDGAEIVQESCVRLLPGASCLLSSGKIVELLHFAMPRLS